MKRVVVNKNSLWDFIKMQNGFFVKAIVRPEDRRATGL